jgi:Fic family protein
MEMALSQDEKMERRFYSLSSRMMKERGQYYAALERAQRLDNWYGKRKRKAF